MSAAGHPTRKLTPVQVEALAEACASAAEEVVPLAELEELRVRVVRAERSERSLSAEVVDLRRENAQLWSDVSDVRRYAESLETRLRLMDEVVVDLVERVRTLADVRRAPDLPTP